MNTSCIHQFLALSAAKFPEKTALVAAGKRVSYSQLHNEATSLAKWLVSMGIGRGDRVVMVLENSHEYVVGYYGTLMAGAVIVPLSFTLSVDAFKAVLVELDPSAIMIARSKLEGLQPALADSGSVKARVVVGNHPKPGHGGADDWGECLSKGGHLDTKLPKVREDELATIIYTSGSMGKPKGVMLSHKNVVTNTKSIVECLKLTKDDIQMVVLPFSYVMGKSLLNTHIAVGGTVVINNTFAFAASVIRQMVDEKVTGFSGVPSTYAFLLHRSPLARFRGELTHLRYCSQAGGHMANQTKVELRKILPEHTEIFVMYGATEAAARLSVLEPSKFEEKMGSIGKAIPGVTLKIVGPSGKEMARGELGELVAKGDNIMQGYWKDEHATKKVLDNLGYHTGDLGYMDEDGYIVLTGRKDSLLKVGGHRISPQEVEEAIMSTGLVQEVTVIGIPDSLLGNRLVGIASTVSRTTTSADILAQTRTKLAKHKVPSEIKVVASVPKNSNGKIDKAECLALVQ